MVPFLIAPDHHSPLCCHATDRAKLSFRRYKPQVKSLFRYGFIGIPRTTRVLPPKSPPFAHFIHRQNHHNQSFTLFRVVKSSLPVSTPGPACPDRTHEVFRMHRTKVDKRRDLCDCNHKEITGKKRTGFRISGHETYIKTRRCL